MRNPTRLTWVIAGGIAALLLVAVLDGLRSSPKNPASPRPTASTISEREASLTAREEIEQAGNQWARLFAAGDRRWAAPGTCKFMTQRGCERISCERIDRRAIEDCTRPSWEFRKSFAHAKVTAIVIRGEQAGARFSNGETVQFMDGVAWWINDFGANAGRKFFK
jgi:hypothetical protein